MISCRLCQPTHIRSREVSEGRLLHVRVPHATKDTALDVLNVYQYVWNMFDDSPSLRQKRQRLLHQLEATFRECPQRNLCLCAGDFNVQLTHHAGLVGMSTTLREDQPQAAQDSEVIRVLLTAQQLIALNTWTGSRKHAFTYTCQQSQTQIDYILVRRHQVTRRMRMCRPLRNFPIAAWRTCGMHRPIHVDIDYEWRPTSTSSHKHTKINIEQIRHDMQQNTLQNNLNMDAINQNILQFLPGQRKRTHPVP